MGYLSPITSLGDSLDIPFKIDEEIHVVTISKLQETYRIVDSIIEGLDDLALAELYGGGENDVGKIFDTIVGETYKALFGIGGIVKEGTFLYLDKLTKNIEETFRVEILNYFIASVLTDFEINWHHLEWGNICQTRLKFAILAARDHGKSFFFSNALPIWKMYRAKPYGDMIGHKRKDLILSMNGYIITNEMDLGGDLLEIIKGTIEGNAVLRDKLYPSEKDSWAKEKIKTKNGATLRVRSYGSSFRGRHPGYIIVDDFLKDNVIYSELQRKKAIDYFHAVIMNAIVPGGQVPVVGTPFHEADLYGDLKSKPGWLVLEYPAIFPDGKVLWPGRYSFDDLMRKKDEQGNLIFSRESLVRPIVSDSSLFPYELIKRAFVGMEEYTLVNNIEAFPISFSNIVVGCDFALSATVGADYSVSTVWGINEQEEMWLLHISRFKGKSYQEQIAHLKNINMNFRPTLFFIESNQMQMIFGQGLESENIPVITDNTGINKYDLKRGVPSLVLMFERNKVKLPRGDKFSCDMTDLLASEFASMTWTDKGLEGVGAHDDIPMSTWQAKKGMSFVKFGFDFTFA
ncbi:MAG TPA: hypothetical protein PKY56_02980 [Candidatus Kapabacteria bacterium]|nr:hypothetical protein [Candidatus Kapabacteria bacterium]